MATASITAPSELDYRPSYKAAGAVSAAVLLLYILTLAPSTAMWDTSEYIAAAYTLGLPHPPGNPFFVLLGRVFTILPIAPNIAMRINLLAAISSAVSAGMWFLITERVLVGWFPRRGMRILGGAIAALIGATAFTVWNQSVVNEKVYTVSLVGIAIVAWLMIRWSDEPVGPKADRILILVAYLIGLGYSNHMGGMLAAPAVAIAVLVRRPQTVLRWKLLLVAGAVMLFGLTPFATQPIRAAHNPAVNEGDPTACRNGLEWDCTFSKGTWEAFKYNFNRGQYGKPQLTERQAPFTGQVGMYWYYFKWQWLRDAHRSAPGLQAMLAATFLVLGLFGGWVHYKRDRRSFWFFGSLMFTMSLLLIYYLNFKYGATQSPELGDSVAREVRDRDYFYLWSFSAWGVWIALGLLFIWESIASFFGTQTMKLGRETVAMPSDRGWKLSSPVLAIALIPLVTNFETASRRGDTYTRDFAHDLLNSVEPYGILVTVGDNDTFPLWYAQEVEGIRRDVTVANTSLLNTDWYGRQILRRPIHEYDPAKGPALYRDRQWPRPTRPPLSMTVAEVDAIPQMYQIPGPQSFQLGGYTVTVDPQNLEYGVLQRADLLVLRMLADSDRPLYFSRTSAGYANSLGLGNNILAQGLASKVFQPPAAPGRDTMRIAGEGWVDVTRSKRLWTEVFEAPESLIRHGDWLDRPSVGIPFLYVYGGVELAQAVGAQGDTATARKIHEQAMKVAGAVRILESIPESQRSYNQQIPTIPLPAGDSARGRELPVESARGRAGGGG